MTRWSEADLEKLQARTVGPTGSVSTCAVPITSHVTKYGNKPTVVDNIRFDSQAEAKRYNELKLFQHAGQICDLELQPKFPLLVNGELVCTYIGDFRYYSHGYQVIEDVKSKATKTPQYRIKVKLLKALTGIEVREVA
jgi:hypothetical protein